MRFFGLLLLLVLTATGGLAFHNWYLFTSPDEISLGFTTIQFPLELILLGILTTVTVLFLMNLIYLQSSAILELHRHSKELQANRELIDKAEKSRMTELKKSFENEIAKQSVLNDEVKAELLDRANQIEINLQTFVEQLDNTFDAYIGELEDRLEKGKVIQPTND